MKMCLVSVVSLLVLAVANAQEFASDCPSPDGFFADSQQCDKYYECIDNVLTEKLCPDGMAFNDINPDIEKCDLLSMVDCTQRPNLQIPQPTEFCDRQNGNYAPKDAVNCQEAYRCVHGTGTLISCPEGLAFSLPNGICDWPDQTDRTDCNVANELNFTCPNVKPDVAVSHPRYADPHDCQYFYVCINGETPRRNGCAFGQVYNTKTTTCLSPKEVPECADYYKEYFDDYFATLERDPSNIKSDIIAVAIATGYNVPKFRDRVRIQSGSRPPTRRGSAVPPTTPRTPSRLTLNTPVSKPTRRQPIRRGPAGGIRRRKKKTTSTTTTTTTTTLPPDDYYYYYYEDEYPVGSELPSPDVIDPIPDETAAASPIDGDALTFGFTASDSAPPSRPSLATRTNVPTRRPFVRPSN